MSGRSSPEDAHVEDRFVIDPGTARPVASVTVTDCNVPVVATTVTGSPGRTPVARSAGTVFSSAGVVCGDGAGWLELDGPPVAFPSAAPPPGADVVAPSLQALDSSTATTRATALPRVRHDRNV